MLGSSSTKVSVVWMDNTDSPRVTSSWNGCGFCNLIPNTLAKKWPTFVLVEGMLFEWPSRSR